MSQNNKAKLATLDSIIDLMDRSMLDRTKKKTPPASAPEPEAPVEEVASAPEDGLDEESARKLMDLYGSESPA